MGKAGTLGGGTSHPVLAEPRTASPEELRELKSVVKLQRRHEKELRELERRGARRWEELLQWGAAQLAELGPPGAEGGSGARRLGPGKGSRKKRSGQWRRPAFRGAGAGGRGLRTCSHVAPQDPAPGGGRRGRAGREPRGRGHSPAGAEGQAGAGAAAAGRGAVRVRPEAQGAAVGRGARVREGRELHPNEPTPSAQQRAAC